jgi:hypothetical protein
MRTPFFRIVLTIDFRKSVRAPWGALTEKAMAACDPRHSLESGIQALNHGLAQICAGVSAAKTTPLRGLERTTV